MSTLISTIITRARVRILESLALNRPLAPLVGPQGTPGVATCSYVVVATNTTGHSQASLVGTTALANAVLSGANFNQLTWTEVPRGTGYKVYRTVGGPSVGLIATLASTVLTLNDTGLAGDASIAPTDNTSGTIGTFWSDDELLDHAINGCKDMWRDFLDLHQEHFNTIDETNMTLPANTAAISGIPSDVYRVLLIEPRDVSDNGQFNNTRFVPAKFNSPEARAARRRDVIDAEGAKIYYSILQAGAPVGTMTIRCQPKVATAIPLLVQYLPTMPALTVATANPIPGETDLALEVWISAHALAKEREDRSPDPNLLAVYKTEKDSALVVSAPRQEQEPIVVRGIFDDMYDDY